MPPQTPYTSDLDNREVIGAMRDTVARTRATVGAWRPDEFERALAPGKWTVRQILTHLAQSEIALGYRARMALTVPGYTAQPFDQDKWMAIEAAAAGPASGTGEAGKSGALSGHDALDAFVATAAMNIALFGSLSDADRATTLTHPEYGSLTVDWIIHQIAGHQIHHLKQLEAIATC
jgi:hypothetical protein